MYNFYIYIYIQYLVGGWPTPLKNMKVTWHDDISNIWKNKIHVPNHQPAIDWFKGQITGNQRFSHEIWDYPVIAPLNQSIENMMLWPWWNMMYWCANGIWMEYDVLCHRIAKVLSLKWWWMMMVGYKPLFWKQGRVWTKNPCRCQRVHNMVDAYFMFYCSVLWLLCDRVFVFCCWSFQLAKSTGIDRDYTSEVLNFQPDNEVSWAGCLHWSEPWILQNHFSPTLGALFLFEPVGLDYHGSSSKIIIIS